MLDRQACLNHAAAHVAHQNCLAVRPGPNGTIICAYRTTSAAGRTLKCAVGSLIPDDRYDLSFEGHSSGTLRMQRALNPAFGSVETNDDVDFISELQRYLHDRFHPGFNGEPTRLEFSRQNLIWSMQVFAKKWNLQAPLNLPLPDPNTKPAPVARQSSVFDPVHFDDQGVIL